MKPNEQIAYDLGWSCGYHDEIPDNPYEAGTEEYKQYEEGYEQGSRDC